MKRSILRFSLVLSVFCLFMACKKETSTENGTFGGTASGELVDSLGNCKNSVVMGTYSVDTPLNTATNYVVINVNFTSQGKYKIYSDTVNGMWFIDSGFAISTGATTIKLKGYGTPILPKASDFALTFNNAFCGFTINVSGSGSTGGTGTNGDYFPTTSGSSWAYRYSPAINSISTFNVTAIPGLVAYNGLNYAQFVAVTNSSDTFYFAKDGGGNYYALSTVDFDYTLLFQSFPNSFTSYIFLKEGANVGESWTSDDYGPVTTGGTNSQTGSSKALFKIIEKDGTHTVGGKLYTQVINVERDILFKPNGSANYTVLVTGNSYYAKNYGLIDQVINTSPIQNVSTVSAPVIK